MKLITLTKGATARVDDDDFEWLSGFNWNLDSKGYAQRKAGKSTVRMHREILRAPAGMDVDHIDGDRLNNQKANLRVCTRSENKRNQRVYRNSTSGFKGVSFHKLTGKWHANIGHNGKTTYLGLHRTAEDAAIAYNEAARRLHGEFAKLNEVRS